MAQGLRGMGGKGFGQGMALEGSLQGRGAEAEAEGEESRGAGGGSDESVGMKWVLDCMEEEFTCPVTQVCP